LCCESHRSKQPSTVFLIIRYSAQNSLQSLLVSRTQQALVGAFQQHHVDITRSVTQAVALASSGIRRSIRNQLAERRTPIIPLSTAHTGVSFQFVDTSVHGQMPTALQEPTSTLRSRRQSTRRVSPSPCTPENLQSEVINRTPMVAATANDTIHISRTHVIPRLRRRAARERLRNDLLDDRRDEKPMDLRQLWYHRRRDNTHWVSFWVAMSVLGLTVVSSTVSITQAAFMVLTD
jgi:hypothetical protein